MIIGCLVLCPPLSGSSPYDIAAVADLAGQGPVPVVAPEVPAGEPTDDARTMRAHWVAHLAIALGTSGAVAPVLLVLPGNSGPLAPALGFSQRAARRAVAGYVLIDADCPAADAVIGDWPDAPVRYLASPQAPALAKGHARLRGWSITEAPDVLPPTIATILESYALD